MIGKRDMRGNRELRGKRDMRGEREMKEDKGSTRETKKNVRAGRE